MTAYELTRNWYPVEGDNGFIRITDRHIAIIGTRRMGTRRTRIQAAVQDARTGKLKFFVPSAETLEDAMTFCEDITAAAEED